MGYCICEEAEEDEANKGRLAYQHDGRDYSMVTAVVLARHFVLLLPLHPYPLSMYFKEMHVSPLLLFCSVVECDYSS